MTAPTTSRARLARLEVVVERYPVVAVTLVVVAAIFAALWVGLRRRFDAVVAGTAEDVMVVVVAAAGPGGAPSRPAARVVPTPGREGQPAWRFEESDDGAGAVARVGALTLQVAPMACRRGECRLATDPAASTNGPWYLRHAGVRLRCAAGSDAVLPLRALPSGDVAWDCRRRVLVVAGGREEPGTWRLRATGDLADRCRDREPADAVIPQALARWTFDRCAPRGPAESITMAQTTAADGVEIEARWDDARLGAPLDRAGAVRLTSRPVEVWTSRSIPDDLLPRRHLPTELRAALATLQSRATFRLNLERGLPVAFSLDDPCDAARVDDAACAAYRVAADHSSLLPAVRRVNEALQARRYEDALEGEFSFEEGALVECVDARMVPVSGEICDSPRRPRAVRIPLRFLGVRVERFVQQYLAEPRAERARPQALLGGGRAPPEGEPTGRLQLLAASGQPDEVLEVVAAPTTRVTSGARPPAGGARVWRRVPRPQASFESLSFDATTLGLWVQAQGPRQWVHLVQDGDGRFVAFQCVGETGACAAAVDAVEDDLELQRRGGGWSVRSGPGGGGDVAIETLDRLPIRVASSGWTALESGEVLRLGRAGVRARFAGSRDDLVVPSDTTLVGRRYPLGGSASSLLGYGRQLPGLDASVARGDQPTRLSLDLDLQRRVYGRLVHALRVLNGRTAGRSGRPPAGVPGDRRAIALVMDYRDGAILAAAAAPGFEPDDVGVRAEQHQPRPSFLRWLRRRGPAGRRRGFPSVVTPEVLRAAHRSLAWVTQSNADPLLAEPMEVGSIFKPLSVLLDVTANTLGESPFHPSRTPRGRPDEVHLACASPESRADVGSLEVEGTSDAIECTGKHDNAQTLAHALSRSCNLFFARAALSSVFNGVGQVRRIPWAATPAERARSRWFVQGLSGVLHLEARAEREPTEGSPCAQTLGRINEHRSPFDPAVGPDLAFETGDFDFNVEPSADGTCVLSTRNLASLGFGQGVRLTPVYVAALYARIANAWAARPEWVMPWLVPHEGPVAGPAVTLAGERSAWLERGLHDVFSDGTARGAGEELQGELRRAHAELLGKTGSPDRLVGSAHWLDKGLVSFLRPLRGTTAGAADAPPWLVVVMVQRVRRAGAQRAHQEVDAIAWRLTTGIYRDLFALHRERAGATGRTP